MILGCKMKYWCFYYFFWIFWELFWVSVIFGEVIYFLIVCGVGESMVLVWIGVGSCKYDLLYYKFIWVFDFYVFVMCFWVLFWVMGSVYGRESKDESWGGSWGWEEEGRGDWEEVLFFYICLFFRYGGLWCWW